MDITILTDVGQRRTNNQDYANQYKNKAGKSMVLLADGMGGHRAGNIASEMAVTDLGAAWVSSEIETVNQVREWFAEHLEAVNRRIHLAGQDDEHKGMGTTLVAATVYDNILRVANVGDSRLYILGNEITQITRDHSLVEEMVRLGEVRKEDAKDHPDKNIITRAVGVLPEVTADFFEISLKPGDEILMCSDGLTNMIEDDEIRHIVLGQRDIVEKAEKLIETANRNGGKDNITVVLIEPFSDEVKEC